MRIDWEKQDGHGTTVYVYVCIYSQTAIKVMTSRDAYTVRTRSGVFALPVTLYASVKIHNTINVEIPFPIARFLVGFLMMILFVSYKSSSNSRFKNCFLKRFGIQSGSA